MLQSSGGVEVQPLGTVVLQPVGQTTPPPQPPDAQVAEHEQDALQSTSLLHEVSKQSTLQAPGPQLMPPVHEPPEQ